MNTLFTAIYAKYLASGLPAAGLTGLYNTQAPADAAFPYCVFSLISDVPDWTFTENFENCLIQFSLFSKPTGADKASSSEVCNLFELLKTMLDFVDLTISGYTSISLTREMATLLRANMVWQYTVTYRILLQDD